MSNFYARVCEKGHVNITYRRAAKDEHCPECGLPLIDSCPECGSLIKQWHYYGMVYLTPKNLKFELPDVCPKCGAPFPWSKSTDDATAADNRSDNTDKCNDINTDICNERNAK